MFILLIRIVLGMIPIPLPGLGTINFGVAGGPLFVALIIGHFGKLGPIQARYYQPSTRVISDLGLVLFLAGAGTTAGQGIVEVVKVEGFGLVFGGALITLTPILAGYFIAKKWFHLSTAHSLGALCGGMTSTPGLGAVNQLMDSDEPAIAYAAAYPFALIFVAIIAQILVFFL
jgi:putative transport protein